MTLFKELNAEATTIIQATYSELNAAFAGRIINLVDGTVVSDDRTVQKETAWPDARKASVLNLLLY